MYKFEDVFSSSQEYANRFSGDIGRWLLATQENVLLELLESRRKFAGMLLDIGGGHGQLASVAKSLGKELLPSVSHIDAINNLNKRRSELQQEPQVGVVSDLFALPYKDKSFEIVSCVRLLSHCEDWPRLLAEICRVSADFVIIDYPPTVSSNILYRLLFPLKKMLEGNTRSFNTFSHKEIDLVFSKNGYVLGSRIGQFFWPMVLHRKIKSVRISKTLEGIAEALGLIRYFGNPTIAIYHRSSGLNANEVCI